jgi:hypothetical protein
MDRRAGDAISCYRLSKCPPLSPHGVIKAASVSRRGAATLPISIDFGCSFAFKQYLPTNPHQCRRAAVAWRSIARSPILLRKTLFAEGKNLLKF